MPVSSGSATSELTISKGRLSLWEGPANLTVAVFQFLSCVSYSDVIGGVTVWPMLFPPRVRGFCGEETCPAI